MVRLVYRTVACFSRMWWGGQKTLNRFGSVLGERLSPNETPGCIPKARQGSHDDSALTTPRPSTRRPLLQAQRQGQPAARAAKPPVPGRENGDGDGAGRARCRSNKLPRTLTLCMPSSACLKYSRLSLAWKCLSCWDLLGFRDHRAFL